MPPASPNRGLLEAVAQRLRPLLDDLVFVGGHLVALLATDPAVRRVRVTTDVDVVVRVASRAKYAALGERLRALGFREDMDPDAPLCRWRSPDGHALDVMPLDESVLGFSNRWYAMGIESAVSYDLTDDLRIRILQAPVFLATKWEAFRARGKGDLFGSHDIEDIITLTAARPGLVAEVSASDRELRLWLAAETRRFLDAPGSSDAIEGALPDARLDPTIVAHTRARLESMASA